MQDATFWAHPVTTLAMEELVEVVLDRLKPGMRVWNPDGCLTPTGLSMAEAYEIQWLEEADGKIDRLILVNPDLETLQGALGSGCTLRANGSIVVVIWPEPGFLQPERVQAACTMEEALKALDDGRFRTFDGFELDLEFLYEDEDHAAQFLGAFGDVNASNFEADLSDEITVDVLFGNGYNRPPSQPN